MLGSRPTSDRIVPLTLKYIGIVLLFVTRALSAEPAGADYVVSYIEGSTREEITIPVIRLAYERIGVRVRFEPRSASESITRANAGEVDAELQRIGNVGNRFPDLMRIAIPISAIEGVAFAKDPGIRLHDWSSLAPYRIGIVKGILFAAAGTEGMNVRVAENNDQLLRLLLDGEIDIAVNSRDDFQDAIRRAGATGIHQLDDMLELSLLYHYVHRRHADLAPRLQAELAAMLKSGELLRLRRETEARLLQQTEKTAP